MLRNPRSYLPDHKCRSSRACINWAVMRTLWSDRATEPSTTASTRNSLAMARKDLRAPLYLIADVREITRSEVILDTAEINSSVMPSQKYSCAGSPEWLSSGKTANESMRG